MNAVYIDTNIFLYLFDHASPFYNISSQCIEFCQQNNFSITTSCETFQEIVHVAKKRKHVAQGLQSVQKALRVVDQVFNIDMKVIHTYLEFIGRHNFAGSRDALHVACSLENNLSVIITSDRAFKNFKAIDAYTPEEFLKKYS